MAWICPEYMGERETFSRMMRSVSGVVKAMWQETWRCGQLRGAEAEGRGIGVAGLLCEARPVDGAAIEAGRRAGLEAAAAQAETLEAFAEKDAGRLAAAAGGIVLLAAVDEAIEKCAGGDDDGAGVDGAAVAQLEAMSAARAVGSGVDQQIDDFGLLDVEAGLRLEHLAHFDAVLLLVALRARRPDGGTTRGVEQAELDADGIGDFAHDAAEGVDFADEVALGDAADGGVAGHLRDEVEVHGV